jgi:hypothetical protein
MRTRWIFFAAFILTIIASFFIAYGMNYEYPDLPLSAFAVFSTILLAVFALPGLIGISDSKMVKALFLIFFKDPVFLSFPVFQIFLAILSLIAQHMKSVGVNLSFITAWLMLLIIIDLFYILCYLLYILIIFNSPKPLLGMYEHLIGKKIKRIVHQKKLSMGVLGKEILMLADMSKDTNNNAKTITIRTINRLLSVLINPNLSGNKNFEAPTQVQLDIWTLLIQAAAITCTGSDSAFTSDEKITLDTVDIIKRAWNATEKWKEKDTNHDFNICSRELRKIGLFSINHGYRHIIENIIEILGSIAITCISEKRSRINVGFVAIDIKELGGECIKKNQIYAVPAIIKILDQLHVLSAEKKVYLSILLEFMSFVWETNKYSFEYLARYYKSMETNKEVVDNVVKNIEKHFPIDTIRIRGFLDAVNKFNNPWNSMMRKIINIWKNCR